MPSECIFCKLQNTESKVDETDNFYAILDIKPKTEGHTLIISKKHYKTLLDIPDTLFNEMISFAKKIALQRIKEGAEGFNLILNTEPSAGQLVMHAHLHIIPRKKGDDIRL